MGGGREMAELAEVLPSFVECKELVLTGHCLGDDGMKALVEKLPRMPKLEILTLAECQFGVSTLRLLMDILPSRQGAASFDRSGSAKSFDRMRMLTCLNLPEHFAWAGEDASVFEAEWGTWRRL